MEIDLSRHSQTPPSMDPKEGLIWGYRFTEDGQAEILRGDALQQALERQESWIWLHFDLADTRTKPYIDALPHLPAEAIEILTTTDDRQRVENFGSVIAGVVVDFERGDIPEVRQMVRWQFVMASHLFVSARRRPLMTLNQLHRDVQAGRKIPGVLHLFDAIIHAFATALATMVHQLSDELDKVEDGLLDEAESGDYEALGTARRNAVRLRRQAVPLRAMLHTLLTDRPAWFTDDAAEDCEQVSARIDSLCADLQSLQERAHALQDELSARQGEETNRRLTTLSVMSALLLPPTLVTGIFGMNVEGLPFKESGYGFIATCALLVLAVAMAAVVLRRLKLI